MYIRIAAVIAFSLLLSSCQIGVDVEVSGSAAVPVITLSRMGLFSSGEPPEIDRLQVTESSTKGWPLAWAVNGESAGCKATPKVVYGQTPPGFIVSSEARALREGATYEVSIGGCGSIGGALFKIVKGRVETVDPNSS